MNPATMLSDPEAGLAYAAAHLARELPALSGDEALDAALQEFRKRGVEPLLPAIQKARVVARAAARERNDRLRAEDMRAACAVEADLPKRPDDDVLNGWIGRLDGVDGADAFEARAALLRLKNGMVRTGGSGRMAPTPFVWTNPARIPRRQWLYGRHLIRGEVSLTLAPGGVGKTSLAAAEAAAMASGRALLHDHPERALRVWWWNGEEPEDEMLRRVMAVAKHYGLPPHAFGDRLFIDNGHSLPLVLAEQSKDGTRILTPVVDRLVDALKARKIDVMLVDPFVSTHSVHENDNSAIQQAASAWKAVAQQAGVAIGLAHHTRKPNGREITAEDSRGGDALVSKVRDARALNPMGETDATKLGIPTHERHGYFSTGTGGKSNMAPKGDRKTWFQLVSVGLGNGALNAPEDRVAVVTKWEPAKPVENIDPVAVARLADIVGEAEWRADWRARKHEMWIGRAVAEAFEIGFGDGWEGRARPLITALEARGVLIRTTALNEWRKPMPVLRLGNPQTAEI